MIDILSKERSNIRKYDNKALINYRKNRMPILAQVDGFEYHIKSLFDFRIKRRLIVEN